MITQMKLLKHYCEECGERADFEIKITGDELPKYNDSGIPYYREGTLMKCYCEKHLPDRAKQYWNDVIPDMPKLQL